MWTAREYRDSTAGILMFSTEIHALTFRLTARWSSYETRTVQAQRAVHCVHTQDADMCLGSLLLLASVRNLRFVGSGEHVEKKMQQQLTGCRQDICEYLGCVTASCELRPQSLIYKQCWSACEDDRAGGPRARTRVLGRGATSRGRGSCPDYLGSVDARRAGLQSRLANLTRVHCIRRGSTQPTRNSAIALLVSPLLPRCFTLSL